MRWEMDQVFDRFFSDVWAGDRWGETGLWAPALDVKETEDEVVVHAELPGVDPKDLDITISGELLTLSGKKEVKTEKKEENWFHSECRYGEFRRSVTLPAAVETKDVNADYKNGVLTIRVKKSANAQAKKIAVKAS
jgi:HSP20 family protein